MTPVRPSDVERDRFAGWVRDHHAGVFQCAWRIVRSRADADDVVQQLFLEVLQKPDAIASHPEPARALRWLAVKRALSFRRGETSRRRREEAHAMEHPEVERARPGDEAVRREQLRAVRLEVAALPDELRVATVLRFQEGLTFAAMAELADVSEPTMFERVERALAKLRAALTRAGHGAVAAELEGLLAVEEVAAVPPQLGATLLALAESPAAAGVAVGSGIGAGWLAAAAAAVVVAAGGAVALRATRSSPIDRAEPAAATAADGTTREGGGALAGGVRRDPEPLPDPATAPPPPDAARDANARDFLWSGGLLTPDDVDQGRTVATAHLRGTVVDDDDRSFARVKVTAFSSDGAPKAFQWRTEGETQDDGSFDLKVAVGVEGKQHYFLELAHDDALPRRIDARVAAGETAELGRVCARRNVADRAGDFELTLTIVGRQGEPIPGVEVRLHRKLAARPDPTATDAPTLRAISWAWEAGGMTDASGAVRLAGHRVGEKRVEVRARRAGFRDRSADLRVDVTGASAQQLKLEPGLSIRGRLVMVEGGDSSWSGSSITVGPVGGGANDLVEPHYTQPAADGRFVVCGLDPGRYRMRIDGHFAAALIGDVEAGGDEFVVELKRRDDPRDVGSHLAEIHGRAVAVKGGTPVVVDPDDVDVIEVPAGWPSDDPRIESELLPWAEGRQRAQQMEFDPDAVEPPPTNGLHVTGLDAGSYLLVVRAKGFARARSRVVSLKEREIVADLVVSMERSE